MTDEEVCALFAQLRLHQSGGKKAPHKPLLLLLALGRLIRDEPQFASFDKELAGPLARLIQYCWPTRSIAKPEYPFWRMRTDGHGRLWRVPESERILQIISSQRSKDVSSQKLAEATARGGFADEVDSFLRKNPQLVRTLAEDLLLQYIEPTQRERVRKDVGLG